MIYFHKLQLNTSKMFGNSSDNNSFLNEVKYFHLKLNKIYVRILMNNYLDSLEKYLTWVNLLKTSYLSESVEEGPWQAFTPTPLV